jgi:hypothetical protein
MDRATGRLWTRTRSNRKSVIDLLAQYKLDNPSLCRIRCDDEFNTDAVKAWALKREILILPKVPHEHDLTHCVERSHETLQNAIVKMLAGKEDYLENKFWAMAAEHATYLFNNTPIKSLNGKTPNSLWDIKPPDLIEFPMHPFGTRVVGHTPLALQSALSGRGFDGIFVGVAHQHRAAIEVFDTKTKRVKTRHTYKSLGTTRDNPVYVVETEQSSNNTSSTANRHIQEGAYEYDQRR